MAQLQQAEAARAAAPQPAPPAVVEGPPAGGAPRVAVPVAAASPPGPASIGAGVATGRAPTRKPFVHAMNPFAVAQQRMKEAQVRHPPLPSCHTYSWPLSWHLSELSQHEPFSQHCFCNAFKCLILEQHRCSM